MGRQVRPPHNTMLPTAATVTADAANSVFTAYLALLEGTVHHDGMSSRLLSSLEGRLVGAHAAALEEDGDGVAVKPLQPVDKGNPAL